MSFINCPICDLSMKIKDDFLQCPADSHYEFIPKLGYEVPTLHAQYLGGATAIIKIINCPPYSFVIWPEQTEISKHQYAPNSIFLDNVYAKLKTTKIITLPIAVDYPWYDYAEVSRRVETLLLFS